MNIISLFSAIALLATFSLGTVPSHHAVAGVAARSMGPLRNDCVGTQIESQWSVVVRSTVRRSALDTVGGTPAR
jgi:hypothetical protein